MGGAYKRINGAGTTTRLVMLPDPFHDIQLDIGRFVMCCTSLEWLAFGAIHQLEPDAAVAATLADQEIQRRVVALLELSRRQMTGAATPEWLLLWERVCSLLQDRRAILHNPLLLELWENDQGEHLITASIHQFRRRGPAVKPLTPAFIREAADKAERYALEAHRLWSICFPDASLFEH